jgi:ATP-dependent exoDNAse (exonuclease V) beta subunit
LVHSLLAAIDFDADAAAIQAAAAVHGRLVDATTEEIDAAANAILAALAHPVMRVAAGASSRGIRRETPLLLRRPEGAIVEGVVDLAVREKSSDFDGWTVVDFKTSREFEASQAEYSVQVALYVEAIQKATRLPARGILLVV